MTNPGWYPDPEGGQSARWWDGTQWTEHHSPLAPVDPKAPAGTKTDTVWIWLIAFLPLVGLATIFTIDFPGYMRSVLQNPSSTANMLSLYTSPGFIISTVLGWVMVAFVIFAAYRDHRTLLTRGVPSPFPWALAFLGIAGWGIVYPIGRGIVVKRRTGQGQAPMWVAIAVFVALIVAGLIWGVVITSQIFSMIPSYSTIT